MVEHLQSGDQSMAPEYPAWQAMSHFKEIEYRNTFEPVVVAYRLVNSYFSFQVINWMKKLLFWTFSSNLWGFHGGHLWYILLMKSSIAMTSEECKVGIHIFHRIPKINLAGNIIFGILLAVYGK